jgi:hypothetical protein
MKKVIYSLFGFAALSFVSCDYHDPNDGKFFNDREAGYVTFANAGETEIGFDPAVETEFQVSVPVVIGSTSNDIQPTNVPVNESGLVVNYTIEDISGSSDFITKTGSVKVPKGALTAYIPFTIPANAVGAGCADFVITLDSTGRDNVTVGNDGEGILTHTVHIGPASKSLLAGTYDVVQSGDVSASYTVSITPGEAPNEIIIHGLFNTGATSNTTVYIGSTGQLSSPADFNDNFLFNAGPQGDVFVANVMGVAYCDMLTMDFVLKTTTGDVVLAATLTKQ